MIFSNKVFRQKINLTVFFFVEKQKEKKEKEKK